MVRYRDYNLSGGESGAGKGWENGEDGAECSTDRDCTAEFSCKQKMFERWTR